MWQAIQKKQNGFSFLEVLFALLILSFGILGYLTLFAQMTKTTLDDEFALTGSNLASQKIEEIISTKATSGYAGVAVGTDQENINYGDHAFTRQTLVSWVNASDLQTVSPSETGFKRIDVTVGWNSGNNQSVQMTGLISNY